jgi:plasmid stabilization system protein ParE
VSTFRVIILPKADADVLEAFAWIAERSPNAAARWLAGLRKAIGQLNKMPLRHPIALEESERFGVEFRQMTYGRKPGTYRILFTVEGYTVLLHYIRHSARDLIEEDD